MKHLIIFWLLLAPSSSDAQKAAESSKAEEYWKRAAVTGLHSPLRQRLLDSALAIDPHNAYYWQQKAMPLFKAQKCEAGMSFLDSAVKYNPQKYLPYRAFMKCLFQRSYRAAIIDLNAAKKMDSLYYEMDHAFDFYFSICYLQLNSLDTAAFYSKKCINDRRRKYGTELDHYLHFFYDGIIQMEKENYEEALKSLDVAVGIYPHFSDGKFYQAKCYLYLNDYEKATTLFRQSLEDIQKGYTIAEDNVIHERYPYQIKERWVQSYITAVEATMKK